MRQETTVQQVWEGDVPSPQDMRTFQEVDARFPGFFMDRVTNEQNWRHARVDRVDAVQARVLYSREGRSWASLVFGGAFLAACMLFSYAAFLKEVYWLSATLLGPPFFVTVRQLLGGRKDDPQQPRKAANR